MSTPMDDKQLNSHTLYVTLTPDAENALVMFPYAEAYDGEPQYIDFEDWDDDGNPVIEINLGFRREITVSQEIFLNSNDQVEKYEVSPNIEGN